MKEYRITAFINAETESEAFEQLADEVGKNMGDLTTVFRAEAVWSDSAS